MNGISNVPTVIAAALKAQGVAGDACNLMLPTQTFGEVLGMFDQITIEIITINPDPEAGEVFPLDGKKGTKLALGKIPLQKIANALGIQWDPTTTTILESTDSKSRAKATGAMRKPNGEYVVVSEEKTVDMGAIEEEQRLKTEDDAQRGKIVEINGQIQWEKTSEGKSYPKRTPFKNEAEKVSWIDREVRKSILTYRKFKDERAMTGAKERVIRAFLAIKGTYSPAELSKPFAFPRVTLDAAKMLASPETRAAAVEQLSGSVRSIFGPGADRDLVDVSPMKQIERTYDAESGEKTATAEQAPVDDFQLEAETAAAPEKTPLEKAREHLATYREAVKPSPNATKLLESVLENADSTMEIINQTVDKFEAWLQKRKEGAAT